MKRSRVALVATAALLALGLRHAAAVQAQDPLEAKLVAVGKEAPNFTIPTPSGGQVSLAEASRGKKAVMVNFWFYN